MPAPFPFFQAPLGSALLISKNHTLLRDGKGWGGAREGRVHMAAWLPLPEREWRLCHTCGVCSPFASPEAMPCDDLCGIEQQPGHAHVALSSDPSPSPGQVSSVSPQIDV